MYQEVSREKETDRRSGPDTEGEYDGHTVEMTIETLNVVYN